MSEKTFPLGSLIRIPRRNDGAEGPGLSACVSSGPFTYARVAGEDKGCYLLELLNPVATPINHRDDRKQFDFHPSYHERTDNWRSWSVNKKDLETAELITEDYKRPIGYKFNLGDSIKLKKDNIQGIIVGREKEFGTDLYLVELSKGIKHATRKDEIPHCEFIPDLNPEGRGYFYREDQLSLVTEEAKVSEKDNDMANKISEKDPYMVQDAPVKPTFFQKMSDVMEEGAYRGGVTQISKLARRVLVEVLRDFGVKRSAVRAITEALDTELGVSCVRMGIGLLIDNFPHLKDDARMQLLAREFQVQAAHGGVNALAGAVMEKLMPGILAVVSKLPEPPKEKLRIAEEQAAKAKAAAERETKAEAEIKSIDEAEVESKRAVKAA